MHCHSCVPQDGLRPSRGDREVLIRARDRVLEVEERAGVLCVVDLDSGNPSHHSRTCRAALKATQQGCLKMGDSDV